MQRITSENTLCSWPALFCQQLLIQKTDAPFWPKILAAITAMLMPMTSTANNALVTADLLKLYILKTIAISEQSEKLSESATLAYVMAAEDIRFGWPVSPQTESSASEHTLLSPRLSKFGTTHNTQRSRTQYLHETVA